MKEERGRASEQWRHRGSKGWRERSREEGTQQGLDEQRKGENCGGMQRERDGGRD